MESHGAAEMTEVEILILHGMEQVMDYKAKGKY